MDKEKAVEIIDSIRKECNSNQKCSEKCPFILKDEKLCIFDAKPYEPDFKLY